jgi:outer membrane protein TolC
MKLSKTASTFFLTCLMVTSYIISVAQNQEAIQLTLEDVVKLAQSDAPDALLAETRWEGSYWSYQTYLADFKPQIVLNANTLPTFNRSIESITLPTGEQSFKPRSFMENQMNVNIEQDLALTGATFFLGTGLSRLDIFETDGVQASTSYLSTPLNIGFFQPLFQFNSMKWRKVIEPMLYEERKKQYSEEMEAVANQASVLFFDLLISQLDAQAAERDKANADTLLTLSRGRYEVGKIAETDLLQIELNAMQAEARLAEAQLNMSTNTERLRDYLGITTTTRFKLIPPYDLPDVSIDPQEALKYAMENRSNVVEFQRRLKEAEREVARAKGETGVTASLQGSFGLTQTGPEIGEAYQNLLDQERVTLSLTVPIADWGKSRGRRAFAQSQLELEQRQVQQERENFRRLVQLRAQQFELVRRNVDIAETSLEAARKRYNISYQRYLIGKIPVTDLNLALADQESARRAYLQAIRDFWTALYEVRGLTLYDFVEDRQLILENPEVE